MAVFRPLSDTFNEMNRLLIDSQQWNAQQAQREQEFGLRKMMLRANLEDRELNRKIKNERLKMEQDRYGLAKRRFALEEKSFEERMKENAMNREIKQSQLDELHRRNEPHTFTFGDLGLPNNNYIREVILNNPDALYKLKSSVGDPTEIKIDPATLMPLDKKTGQPIPLSDNELSRSALGVAGVILEYTNPIDSGKQEYIRLIKQADEIKKTKKALKKSGPEKRFQSMSANLHVAETKIKTAMEEIEKNSSPENMLIQLRKQARQIRQLWAAGAKVNASPEYFKMLQTAANNTNDTINRVIGEQFDLLKATIKAETPGASERKGQLTFNQGLLDINKYFGETSIDPVSEPGASKKAKSLYTRYYEDLGWTAAKSRSQAINDVRALEQKLKNEIIEVYNAADITNQEKSELTNTAIIQYKADHLYTPKFVQSMEILDEIQKEAPDYLKDELEELRGIM